MPGILSEDVVIDASTAPLLDIIETPEEERAELSVIKARRIMTWALMLFPAIERNARSCFNRNHRAGRLVMSEMPSEQIARIIGMIQSYTAWFKMWSLS